MSDLVSADAVGYVPDPLYGLGYVSEPTVAFTDGDLADLLVAARRANVHYEITGELWVLEGPEGRRVVRFLQWIEGTEPAVDACFERIEADPRHEEIDVVFRGPIPRRRFPSWDMAFGRVAEPEVFAAEVAIVAVS